MTLQVMEPSERILDPEARRAALRKAREQLDRTVEAERYGWLRTRQLDLKMFGKEKGLTIGECKKLMEEIRKEKVK
jgi:hypothetical protein